MQEEEVKKYLKNNPEFFEQNANRKNTIEIKFKAFSL